MGVWLVVFLTQHLLVNSQAGLLIGEDGKGFINGANLLTSLPYLPILEILILGFPFFIHGIWGLKYLFTAKYNSFGNTGHTPYLPQYSRNRAYTWQRITSWILLVGILLHVVQMRFIERPISTEQGLNSKYIVRVSDDVGLKTVAERLNVQIEKDSNKAIFKNVILNTPLSKDESYIVANDFGTAALFMLRNTFKSIWMCVVYTFLVIFASFHAFNGLWTAMISWGAIQNHRSQKVFLKFCNSLMIVVMLLGLAAVWLTYWVNLYN